jgi:hypothetical protein
MVFDAGCFGGLGSLAFTARLNSETTSLGVSRPVNLFNLFLYNYIDIFELD